MKENTGILKGILALALVLGLLLTLFLTYKGGKGNGNSGIEWSSESTSIIINNSTSEDVIIFQGELSIDNMIGYIQAGSAKKIYPKGSVGCAW